MTAGTSSHLAPASHSSRRPRRLWQCGDVRAREKPVGATSAARGTPARATSARARGPPVGATSGPVAATRTRAGGRPSWRRPRQGTPVGATHARAGDARRGDNVRVCGCPQGRRLRARGTPVGATSAPGRGDVVQHGSGRRPRAGDARRVEVRARGRRPPARSREGRLRPRLQWASVGVCARVTSVWARSGR